MHLRVNVISTVSSLTQKSPENATAVGACHSAPHLYRYVRCVCVTNLAAKLNYYCSAIPADEEDILIAIKIRGVHCSDPRHDALPITEVDDDQLLPDHDVQVRA